MKHTISWLAMAACLIAMLVTPGLPAATAYAQAAAPQTAQPQQPQQRSVAQPQQRAAQDEFVPIADLPDSEKLPAAPFLIAAYTIAWLVLLFYVWSLWRRLTHVEQELKHAVQSAARGDR